MGNQQVGGVVTSEVPGAVSGLDPPQHVTENHPHASAYSRLRRLSLVGSSAEDQPSTSPNGGSGSNGHHQIPGISVHDVSANLHNAHLPQTSESQERAASSRINQLLGLPAPTSRRRGSIDARDPSPSKTKLNNLLNKGEREKSRFPSGGRTIGGRSSGERKASVEMAASSLMTSLNPTKMSPDFMTLAEESGSDLEKAEKMPSVNKNRVSKAKEFLFPAISSAGRRKRRGSILDQGINIKPISDQNPKIPEDSIYEPPSVPPVRSRARALTISNGHAAKASMALAFQKKKEADKAMVPTVFRYTEPIEEVKVEEKKSKSNSKSKDEKKKQKASEGQEEVKVYIAGTMTNWQSHLMVQQIGETDYCSILECPEGEVYYKFGIFRGEDRKSKVDWVVDNSQEVVHNGDFRNPVQANIIRVRKTDREVFSALTVDSFCVKKEGGEKEDSDREKREDLWTQQKPQYDGKDKALKTDKGPPILPPHLLQVILNKEETDPRKYASRADRMTLPYPSSHVMLNHLYAQSIRDNLLVLASTARYRKKCVTIVYYKELPQES